MKRHNRNALIVTAWLMPLLLNFQACSPSFQVSDSLSLASTSGDLTAIDGTILYKHYCSSCHRDLQTSAKLDRNYDQLVSAISSIPSMASLSSLNAGELTAIVSALSTQSNSSDPRAVDKGEAPPDVTIASKCMASTPRGYSNPSNRKLTKAELLATVQSLMASYDFDQLKPFVGFAYNQSGKTAAQIALNSYPAEYVESATRGELFEQVHNSEQIEAWIQFVDAAAEVFVTKKLADKFVDAEYKKAGTSATDWQRNFAKNFGRQAFRRPLTTAEELRFTSVQGSTQSDKVRTVVSLMLLSPNFMFLIEEGANEAPPGARIRLTDYEVASRISYTISGTMPDALLMADADAGKLKTINQVNAHVRRLLATSAAKTKLNLFFGDWLRVDDNVPDPLSAWFAAARIFNDDGTLNSFNAGDAYATELKDFIDYIVWKSNGGFEDLMSAKIAFPKDLRTAGVYGVSPDATGKPVVTPYNPGLLTRAGVLSSPGTNPNAIMRGVMIKRRVLCDDIPSPDFSVVASRVTDIGALDPVLIANHDIVDQTTSPNACMQCHSQINPIGFLFEDYNSLGQKQSKQRVPIEATAFKKYNRTPASIPGNYQFISEFDLPSTQSVQIESGLRTTFTSSDDFISELARSERARACVAVRAFRFMKRRSETLADACALSEMGLAIKQNKPLLDLFVKSVANEDIFWRNPK